MRVIRCRGERRCFSPYSSPRQVLASSWSAGGRRAAGGRLRRNHFVGIRTTLTLVSDTAWVAAHTAGGHHLSTSGFGPLLTGPLLLTHPTNGGGAIIVFTGLGWMVVWILVAGVVGTRAAEQAVRDEEG